MPRTKILRTVSSENLPYRTSLDLVITGGFTFEAQCFPSMIGIGVNVNNEMRCKLLECDDSPIARELYSKFLETWEELSRLKRSTFDEKNPMLKKAS